jgi:hypothetical protein
MAAIYAMCESMEVLVDGAFLLLRFVLHEVCEPIL